MRLPHITKILLVVNWVLMTSTAWAAEGKVVSYRSGGETVSATLYTPPGKGPFPALIAIHAIGGLDDWVKQQASRLAESGYIALAVDLYRGQVASGSADRMPEAREIARNVPPRRRERDLQAAFEFLLTRPDVLKDHIGAIGWCMGGSSAIRLASLEPALKVAVAHYPTGVPQDSATLSKINAAVLLVLGGKDTMFPLESGHSFEQQMKSLGKKVVMVVYQDAGHAFEMPWSGQGYRPEDSADAWKETIAFLNQTLMAGAPDNPTAYADSSPFVGTWKLNLAKSKIVGPDGIRALPLSKSIVTYEALGDQMKISDDDTAANGQSVHMEWTGKFNGKDYPATGDPSADSWSFEKVDDHTLVLTTKKDGKVIATRRVTVSPDGETRTVTGTRADASAKTITVTAVYEKE